MLTKYAPSKIITKKAAPPNSNHKGERTRCKAAANGKVIINTKNPIRPNHPYSTNKLNANAKIKPKLTINARFPDKRSPKKPKAAIKASPPNGFKKLR